MEREGLERSGEHWGEEEIATKGVLERRGNQKKERELEERRDGNKGDWIGGK